MFKLISSDSNYLIYNYSRVSVVISESIAFQSEIEDFKTFLLSEVIGNCFSVGFAKLEVYIRTSSLQISYKVFGNEVVVIID